MDTSGAGKSPNSSFSFRYNANNEELEELYNASEDDPPTPQFDASPSAHSENTSPKKLDKSSSIIDKYFKRVDKVQEKLDDVKPEIAKGADDSRTSVPKEATSSPVKDYLNRFSKRNTSEASGESKEPPNEPWKLFHGFKYKIAQAVEDMKSRPFEDPKDKAMPRDNSISDSEDNSGPRDDPTSVGDTDNQVSSLDSSIQNLSEITQPVTTKANDGESSVSKVRTTPDSNDDTHKNTQNDSSEANKDLLDEIIMDVESGVEALEENHIDAVGDTSHNDYKTPADNEKTPSIQPIASNRSRSPSKNSFPKPQSIATKPKTYFFGFFMTLLTVVLILSYILLPRSNLWNGFILGLWVFYFLTVLKQWILDTYFCEWESDKSSFFQVKRSTVLPTLYTIPSIKEHHPLKKYEGWINHYRKPDYDPYTYHINKTTTAFMKLEGCNLRISYTRAKIAKRALWDEKIDKVIFYQHRLYNLTGARVILLPKGLVRRRQWSKKYPICIILSEKEKIQVLEKENNVAEKKQSETQTEKKNIVEVESAETNTSPEKKKKFVWRRREKSISHTEAEVSKEGLRHRLVRKMHRDKKAENISTTMDPAEGSVDKNLQFEDTSLFHESILELSTKSGNNIKDEAVEDDLDETELLRIKDFLEEAELEAGVEGTSEGEWSVHVKESKDKHSHVYLFARTGRDKIEWFRRLHTAISDAKAASTECSTSDEKTASEGERDIELAVYKVTEKDTVAFAKPTSKAFDTLSDSILITSTSEPLQPGDVDSYEKNFWPYFFKIIQSHEITLKRTTEVGVMCRIDPTPERNKKKKKDVCYTEFRPTDISGQNTDQNKAPSPECSCRTLPGEVTWINTVLARVVFDVMRDPVIIRRVQNRIQRKLHTLKLPSFMSPLVVTELQLGGACPLVEHVLGPSWDERGVWLDADLRYDGGAYISILTQINLMKLKDKSLEDPLEESTEQIVEQEVKASIAGGLIMDRQVKKKKPAVYDSDMEDSAESSSDDDTPSMDIDSSDMTVSDANPNDGGSSKKKFLRMVDKIATNKYFQQVTDYKYVKRAMEGLSNTDIKLQLEVRGLEGRLALNLPPPPHDRLWLGFRTNPQLILKAKPAVGARTLRFAQISNWIEEKLTREFEKVLVLPNMEDIIVDVMTPTPVMFE